MKAFSMHTDLGLLLLRLAVGAAFLYHGLMKWGFFTGGSIGLPSDPIMATLSVIEPIFGLLLILGVYTPLAALVLAVVMVGAISFKLTGYFPNSTAFGAWEFDLVLFAANIVLLTQGAGRFSAAKK